AVAKTRAERRASGARGTGPAIQGHASSRARARPRPKPPQMTRAANAPALLRTRGVHRFEIEVSLQHLLDDGAGGERTFAAVVDERHHRNLGVVERGVT